MGSSLMKNILLVFKTIGIVALSLLILVYLSLFLLLAILGRNSMDDYFEEWTAEIDTDVAFFDGRNGFVEANGKVVDCDSIIREKYGKEWLNYSFFTVKNDLIYGMVFLSGENTEFKKLIDIISIDPSTNQLTVLHSGEYIPDDIKKYEVDTNYSDGKLVIYDGTKTASYNIESGEYEIGLPTDFSYPEQEYTVEKIESETILECGFIIKSKTEERRLTISDMAERNEKIKALTELEAHRWLFFFTTEPLKSFIYGLRVVNNEIYLIGRVFDNDGESNAVVFRYDYDTDSFAFVFHSFSSDSPIVTIIPNESFTAK